MRELVIRARDGDILAKEDLLNRLTPLIKFSIKKYYYIYRDFEDLVQDGYVKILDLLASYDLDSNIYFETYVKINLRYMYLDMNKKKTEELILNGKNEDSYELVDLLQADFDLEELVITGLDLKAIDFDLLTPRERDIIDLAYYKWKSMVKIKDELGISYRTVVNIKANALVKLRKAFKTY